MRHFLHLKDKGNVFIVSKKFIRSKCATVVLIHSLKEAILSKLEEHN
jgi:hypothetical protein